jgi:hypothetical protein
MWGISCLTENLSASQEGLYSLELVNGKIFVPDEESLQEYVSGVKVQPHPTFLNPTLD